MKARTGLGGGHRQTNRIVQRVQMPGVPVNLAPLEGRRPDQAADGGLIEGFKMVIVIVAAQLVGVGMACAHLGIGPAGMGDAGVKGDGHLVIGDQRFEQGFRVLGQRPQAVRLFGTTGSFQPVLIAPLARPDLPAIAA